MDGSRERDQSIEQLLRQPLTTPQRDGVTESCLDAETLAAWADGALSGAVLETVQLHVADCARCQDLVGALARVNSTAPRTESVRASRRWLPWLVPLTAAAAAALLLWVALPGNNVRTALVPQERKVQDNDKVAELRPPLGESPEIRVQPFRATPAPETADTPAARARRDVPQQPAAVPETPSKAESAAADKKVDDAAAREKENVAGRLEVDNLRKTAEPPATRAAPAAPAAAAAPAPPPPERGLARSGVRAADASAREILSPDPAVRWRIVGSAVQHSANGGATWEAASIGVAAELIAGAAPSTMVCWLVGRDGVVLVTTDGRTWRRVAFPEMTDLSSVRATDAGAMVVSVSTADGRTFVTIDGGLTWMSR